MLRLADGLSRRRPSAYGLERKVAMPIIKRANDAYTPAPAQPSLSGDVVRGLVVAVPLSFILWALMALAFLLS